MNCALGAIHMKQFVEGLSSKVVGRLSSRRLSESFGSTFLECW